MSLRDQIITQTKLPARRFTPEGFPAEVEVRGMSGAQRAEFQDFLRANKDAGEEIDMREFYPLLTLGHVYDPATGDRVFTDSDKAVVMGLPGSALEQIAKAALELSGLDNKSGGESPAPAGKD
jgi:hypothetical protein